MFTWPFQDLLAADDTPDSSVTELQVIGAGMPRTGTASLHAALTILGIGPCHHGSTLPMFPERSILYINTVGKPNADYRRLMHGFRSTVDMPNCILVPELMTAFPKAKIILSLRDSPEVWWKSWENTLARMGNPAFFFATLPLRSVRLMMLASYAVSTYRWTSLYGTDRWGPYIYDRHNNWVRSFVPPEKLLEFNVKEGWGPLCKFLDVPVPDVPFPRMNDTTSVNKHITKAIFLGLASWGVIFAGVGGAVYLLKRKAVPCALKLARTHGIL